MNDQEYIALRQAYPEVETIPYHGMVALNLLTQEESDLPGPGVIAPPEYVTIPEERIYALFANNAVRYVIETAAYYPHGKGWYNVFLRVPSGDSLDVTYFITNREYIDVPNAINDFMLNINAVKNALYLLCMSMHDITYAMAVNNLTVDANLPFKLQQFLMQKTESFRQGLESSSGLNKQMIFSKIMPFLTKTEQLKLSEVGGKTSDEMIIANKDKSSAARLRFDRKFGLSKF